MPINKDELFEIFRRYESEKYSEVPQSEEEIDCEFSEDFEKKMAELIKTANTSQKHLTKNTNTSFKKILIAVAIFAALISANFVALACGFDTVSILKDWGNNLTKMVVGEKAEYKGISIIKEKESTYFDSIDTFNKETDYHILYPTVYPEGAGLKEIAIVGSYDADYNYVASYESIVFIANTPQITVTIHTNEDYPKHFTDDPNAEIKEINGLVCYISRMEDVIQCSFIHNSFTYVIKAQNDEDLITIIENLKENR